MLVDADQVSHLLGDLARDAERRCRSPIVLRADVVDAEPESPSGLGRYVVRALAAAHGGTVEDTPTLTGGTTLTVRIPQPRG